jgi:hypothetical protein
MVGFRSGTSCQNAPTPYYLDLYCGRIRREGIMSTKGGATCNDCYFRRAGLCAIPGDAPCPTFRLHSQGNLVPPRQPRLVPRPLKAA